MNNNYFRHAAAEAEKSTFTGACSVKVGAVAVLGGCVIARGHNSNKTSPIQAKYNHLRYSDPATGYYPAKVHAEIACLTKIKYLDPPALAKVEVYVYRELKNGRPAMARPCPSCRAMMRELGIRKVCYSTDMGYAMEVFE